MKVTSEPYMPGADRGWSWVIAIACFCGSLVLAGIFRTSGVLFVAFISSYGVNREEASWPMVVCIAILNLTGPFSGILSQKFGIRPTVIVGSIIAAIGVSSCYFTTSLKIITILFGGVFGIGYGLVSTLLPVILNAYFLNLRATANGIANSGSCIGSVILPFVFEYLINNYGLSGCFLLTGGIILNLAVAGTLMRPPPWTQRNTTSISNKQFVQIKQSSNVNKLDLTKKKFKKTGYLYTESDERTRKRNFATDSHQDQCVEVKFLLNKKDTSSKLSSDLSCENRVHDENCLEFLVNNPADTEPKYESPSILKSFASILTSPMFHVTALTNVCFFFLYHMYVVIIIDYALDRDVPDVDTKNILFAFAISDLFGRLGLGWITDRKFLTRSKFVMLCMLIIGVVFFAFPYAKGYSSLVAVSSVYGLLLGCTMIVFPILLVDFCGLELHAVAYGCMCFMNGFASFGRPFLIGYFRDSVGSYSSIFYILGTLAITSSALWLLEPCFTKKRTPPQENI